MQSTQEIFESLEQDAINIACLGAHLLEEIKTRDIIKKHAKIQARNMKKDV